MTFFFKGQVHSKNNLLSIKAEKSDKPIKKMFEQNRMTNKKVMIFWKKYVKLWNNEIHNTNCQDGYQFVTSCPHYLTIALYGLIPLISLFIPQNLISPWFVSYCVHDIFHKIFSELWRIYTIFWILYIHNYWFLYK